jgi:hypothetical protein
MDMKPITGMLSGLFLALASCKAQEDHFTMAKTLPRALKEVSGLARDGNTLWSISDDNKAAIYQLDLSGNVVQQFRVPSVKLSDVEAVSTDRNYIYVGDVGDNDGRRTARQIVRIPKSSIKNGVARGEVISFTFPDEGAVKKKKANNYDCEAMVVFHDSIYLFTKRREDGKTELYVLPDGPGTYVARPISVFKAKGLVTDAALNPEGTELALIGYDEGHTQPFIWTFSGFHGNDFFSGKHERYELTNQKKLDWQMESISYRDAHNFFLACEKTKDVDNTLYLVNRSELIHSKKGDSK